MSVDDLTGITPQTTGDPQEAASEYQPTDDYIPGTAQELEAATDATEAMAPVDNVPDVQVSVTGDQLEASRQEADAILNALIARIAPAGSNPYLKVLVYGNPGTGKTVFSARSPRPLLVDIEKGERSLLNHDDTRTTQRLEYTSLRQIHLLIEKIAEGNNPIADNFDTIIIDSFSELQKRDLDEVVREEARKDASRNPYLPTGPDYNVNTEHMRQIASALRDLNKHIIVTCHVKEEKDDTTGSILVRPNLTPKLASTLAGIFDVVAYIGKDSQDVRTLQVHPTRNITAKTRLGGLPPVINEPSFKMLLDASNEQNRSVTPIN